MVKNPPKFLSNLIFPPRCVFCNNILEPNHNNCVCARCLLEIRHCADSLCCTKCGKPVVSYGEEEKCYSCLNMHHRFTRAAAPLIYEGNVRYAVIRNKRRRVDTVVSEFARLMSLTVQLCYDGIAFDGIVSTPPSKKSLRKNGHDHIAVISDKVSETLDLPHIKGCLIKTKQTPRQASLNFTERLENLKDTMECVSDVIQKTLLLVDDVLTTGATADECTRALKAAGAKKVYVVTLATTVKENI